MKLMTVKLGGGPVRAAPRHVIIPITSLAMRTCVTIGSKHVTSRAPRVGAGVPAWADVGPWLVSSRMEAAAARAHEARAYRSVVRHARERHLPPRGERRGAGRSVRGEPCGEPAARENTQRSEPSVRRGCGPGGEHVYRRLRAARTPRAVRRQPTHVFWKRDGDTLELPWQRRARATCRYVRETMEQQPVSQTGERRVARGRRR